jgi:hypothetical protein
MRVTAILNKPERKRRDRSVRRTAKRGRVIEVARIRGPIRTHPSGLMKPARHLPHETLDRQAKSGDRAVIRQSTWGMSDELTVRNHVKLCDSSAGLCAFATRKPGARTGEKREP